MNVVWFSWKDAYHPEAGGAEVVSQALRQRLVRDGHSVRLITATYPGSVEHETREGIEIFRGGNRYTVYLKARGIYRKNMQEWEDLVVDEMNTIPFIAGRYTKATATKLLLAYQLAREVWFYQMTFPLSIIGYVLEPLYLRFTARYYSLCATESVSSKKDMERFGFRNVQLFRIGMELQPIEELLPKEDTSTLLSLGSVRPMKRTLEAIKAFEIARDTRPELRLVVAGDTSTPYARTVLAYIKASRHTEAIDVRGRISAKERLRSMQQSGAILVPSAKEGWGLIVTEANSQGTPAIVYDIGGLRDSVKNGLTGVVCNPTPQAMAAEIITLLSDKDKYLTMRRNAWEWSKEFTFENSYQDFMAIIHTGSASK